MYGIHKKAVTAYFHILTFSGKEHIFGQKYKTNGVNC